MLIKQVPYSQQHFMFLETYKWMQLGKSAASICHQVAVWVPDIFVTFLKWKITKLLVAWQQLKPEKNKRRFGILRNSEFFLQMFD